MLIMMRCVGRRVHVEGHEGCRWLYKRHWSIDFVSKSSSSQTLTATPTLKASTSIIRPKFKAASPQHEIQHPPSRSPHGHHPNPHPLNPSSQKSTLAHRSGSTRTTSPSNPERSESAATNPTPMALATQTHPVSIVRNAARSLVLGALVSVVALSDAIPVSLAATHAE